jgi:hypothetical protein
MTSTSDVVISIVVLTFRRLALLKKTIASCAAQSGIDLSTVELVIVDNSPEQSARETVLGHESWLPGTSLTIRYTHEPRPGISHARNTGVAEARGAYIAFIDDDEEADPAWLAKLHACITRFSADAVLGPVYPKFERPELSGDPYWHWCLVRDQKVPTGTEIELGGTGNCLLNKATCFIDAEPFHLDQGSTGGSDTRFFMDLGRRGKKIVWCAEALVWEFAPANRTTLSYMLHRRMRQGQLFSRSFLWYDPVPVGRMARWMLIGAAQALALFPAGLFLWFVSPSHAKKCMTKGASGLGKALWPLFSLKEYGAGAQGGAVPKAMAGGKTKGK